MEDTKAIIIGKVLRVSGLNIKPGTHTECGKILTAWSREKELEKGDLNDHFGVLGTVSGEGYLFVGFENSTRVQNGEKHRMGFEGGF